MRSPSNGGFSWGNAPAIAGLVAASVLWLNGGAQGVQAQNLGVQAARAFNEGGLDVLQLRSNVYLIAGAGANIVAHLGWMGVVLIDSGSQGTSDRVLAVLKRLT